MIEIVIKELEKISEELQTFDYFEIPNSSLLIVYDSEYFLNLETREIPVCSRKRNYSSCDFFIENGKLEKCDEVVDNQINKIKGFNNSESTCSKKGENFSSSSYSSSHSYLKEKLNIKIIDFAILKQDYIRKNSDPDHNAKHPNITNAIDNIIKILKNRTNI